jgi:hypothetical protein
MLRFDDHHQADAPGIVLMYGALATRTLDGHAESIAGPVVACGMMYACCPEQHTVGQVMMSMPVVEAGRIIAAIMEFADRNGLSAALTSAIDQGRSWARSAPR